MRRSWSARRARRAGRALAAILAASALTPTAPPAVADSAVTVAAGPAVTSAASGSAVRPAVAAPERCIPERGGVTVGESWAQRRLGLARVWPITRGKGVKVAVIDSGVDTAHPQLAGVEARDLTGTGARDCVGHGTAVAGIIGAARLAGIPFAGVAPEAEIVSIKQTGGETGDVAVLARAIVEATRLGADVINVSVSATDQKDLRAAVTYALAQDVVIVAAAGNTKRDGVTAPAYPAAYPGVLAVGSAGRDGRRADSSNAATPVSVLAPGQGVTSTWTGRAYREDLEGTSFAAAYVSGVVALVRARHPELDNVRVRRRLELTADGGMGTGTGAGMVNPLLAVTAVLPSETVALAPPVPAALPPTAVAKEAPVDERANGAAAATAVGALFLAGLVAAGGVVIPMGRRRGWRPARRSTLREL
ncbi:type VII secretion-associated serine protease mycosin [Thermocatellispora tengchongensis]|uniref:Type VII secretion-associated serine protease mycosin n=2 Tax=Thermocatellispora tengchongensis TaxID=1073253 RepID=A0A840PF05_9ACTN|nr:S8 family serine peptidase [Thermocatellispora tengchongensis]MBB5138178.1 type VII secretion-associated serine protease mycosin [Thermocatellispora tengchongensis]